jgi:ATP-dependent Lon protease
VLEIGGVKEKVLAAHRAGIRDVILPVGNERDLRDVPTDVRETIRFHFVNRMDDVIELALHSGKTRAAPAARTTSTNRRPRAARKRAS